MSTFTIDSDNNITARAGLPASADNLQSFSTRKELAKLAADWPAARLTETWNSLAGVAPCANLKPVRRFTSRKAALARIWEAVQRLSRDAAQQVPTCNAHLGHVFPDGPAPSGLCSCMNAVALKKIADHQDTANRENNHMRIPGRSVIGMAGKAAGTTAIGATTLPARSSAKLAPESEAAVQLIEHFIIKHGGDCCGCAVSKEDGEILCNECGQNLDVLVAEVAFLRMAEALMRAHHALTATSGLTAHDGKPEHSFSLDHAKNLRFIEETMKLADIDFRALKPLA